MNILHITPYYAPAYAFGGVVRSVEGMARALARRGHHVTVLTTDAFTQTERLNQTQNEILDGVHIIRARNWSPMLRGRLNLSTPFGMSRLARDLVRQADVIHVHEFRTVENLLVTPFAIQTPLVLSPHGTLALHTGRSTMKATWDALLSPSVARRISHVIGLTQDEANEARVLWARFGGRAQFSVIPNGVDPDDYAHLPPPDAFRRQYALGDDIVCLFMGRLHLRKGAHLLAEAFLRADVPGTRLVIVGPDEGGKHRIPNDPRIVLTGYLGGSDRLAAFAAANLLALPAVGEGLPMVALEAMAAGLPVILSPECHLPEVESAGAGFVVEPQIEPLAEALHELLTSAAIRSRMGQAAAQLVRDRFTWASVAESLEAVYLSLKEA